MKTKIKKYEMFMMIGILINVLIFWFLSNKLENFIDNYVVVYKS
jgi:hypothetical protein